MIILVYIKNLAIRAFKKPFIKLTYSDKRELETLSAFKEAIWALQERKTFKSKLKKVTKTINTLFFKSRAIAAKFFFSN